MNLRTFRDMVSRIVRDGGEALNDAADLNQAITQALQTYSLLRPRAVTQDVNTQTNGLLLVSSITGFDVGNVEKMLIEYPITGIYGQPIYLDRSEWSLYQSTTGMNIRFNYPPSSTQAIRITHAIAHVLPLDGSNNPDDEGTMTPITSDLPALANEAAANACEMLAAYYRQSADQSTGTDFVGFPTKAGQYASGAKMHHGIFTAYMDASLGQGRGSFKVVRS